MCTTTAMSSTTSVAALAASGRQLGASTHARISDLLPDLSEPWFERLGGILSDSHSGRTLPCLH